MGGDGSDDGDATDVNGEGDGSAGRPGDVGAFIRQQREVARLSIRRLADLAGVSNPYLSQIERGLRRPSAEILQQVAEALRISVETLYVRAGLLREEDARGSGVVDAIADDPLLSDEQKRALTDVYRSFVETRRAETYPETPAQPASDPATSRR